MRFAVRAKSILTLQQEAPARGPSALDAPLRPLADGVVTVNGTLIEAVEPYAAFRKGRGAMSPCPLIDLGDVTLAPGLINGHCHLELSHLAGMSTRGKGFTPWLRSIVSLVSEMPEPARLRGALHFASQQLVESYTAHVGDVSSRAPQEVASALSHSALLLEDVLADAAEHSDQPFTRRLPRPAVSATHFLEVLGFMKPRPPQPGKSLGPDDPLPLPPLLSADGYAPAAAASLPKSRYQDCAVSGHALYTTSPEGLRAAHAWCRHNNKPFSLHLAESAEETAMIAHGKGELYDFLAPLLLPGGWQSPGLRPVPFARSLGLLGPNTLAIHCVQCDSEDIALLALAETACCLCPRSNAYIGSGEAPAQRLAKANILLCLGTDGLSSNDDLDLGKEMRAAKAAWGFSDAALLRMVTVNAARALGLSDSLGSIEPGKRAAFSIIEYSI